MAHHIYDKCDIVIVRCTFNEPQRDPYVAFEFEQQHGRTPAKKNMKNAVAEYDAKFTLDQIKADSHIYLQVFTQSMITD